jgi:hypothetical protein
MEPLTSPNSNVVVYKPAGAWTWIFNNFYDADFPLSILFENGTVNIRKSDGTFLRNQTAPVTYNLQVGRLVMLMMLGVNLYLLYEL